MNYYYPGYENVEYVEEDGIIGECQGDEWQLTKGECMIIFDNFIDLYISFFVLFLLSHCNILFSQRVQVFLFVCFVSLTTEIWRF